MWSQVTFQRSTIDLSILTRTCTATLRSNGTLSRGSRPRADAIRSSHSPARCDPVDAGSPQVSIPFLSQKRRQGPSRLGYAGHDDSVVGRAVRKSSHRDSGMCFTRYTLPALPFPDRRGLLHPSKAHRCCMRTSDA